MPDAAVAPPPAAPAPPPSAPPSAPSTPSVTFGGDQGKPPEPSQVDNAAPPQVSDADLKFDFGFGDEGATDAEPTADFSAEVSDNRQPFSEELKALLKDKPELLRSAQRDYYENRGYKQIFKTPQEAQAHMEEVRSLAQSLGRDDGTEGLDAIRAEAQEWAAVQSAFQAGDESVVRQWMDDLESPAREKVMTTALGQWKEKDGPGWARHMAKNFMDELRIQDGSGRSMLTALNRIAELSKENPDVGRELSLIAETINKIDEISRQAPMAPQNTALDAERQQIETEKRNLFVQKLSSRTMPLLEGAAKKAAETVLRGRKLGDEQFSQFAQEIQGEYNRLTKADKDFQQKARALLEAGDDEGFARLHQAQIRKKMPDAARNINRKYTGFMGNTEARRAESASRVEGPAGGSGSGAKIRYSGRMVQGGPDPAVIDWAAMRAMAPVGKNPKDFAQEMLFNREFRVKGDAKNVYFF